MNEGLTGLERHEGE